MDAALKSIAVLCLELVLVMLLMTACQPASRSGQVYSRDQAMTSHSVYYGTVLRVNDVTIEGSQSGVGAVAGGVMGGVLGSTIGGGSGRNVATAAGAIAGAGIGSAAEKNMTTKAGVELEIELDSGQLIVVVQEKDDVYAVGDRVRVLKDAKGTTRVRQ